MALSVLWCWLLAERSALKGGYLCAEAPGLFISERGGLFYLYESNLMYKQVLWHPDVWLMLHIILRVAHCRCPCTGCFCHLLPLSYDA
jgi:hypothetical protein